MSTTPRPDTPESWGAASRGYADNVAPLLMQSFADTIVDRLDPKRDSEILEVGAGSGAITQALCGRAKSVLATDFAPKMIALLEERLRAAGVRNVRCRVMDGQALELKDASFDGAACAFALMLFPDRPRGFSELRRVLRPGGRAVVSAWTGPDRFEAFGLFFEALCAAMPDLPPPPTPPPVFSLADPVRFRSEMERGGFRDVQVDLVPRTLEVQNFDGLWAFLTSGAPPIQMLFDRIGCEGQDRLREALAGIVARRFGNGPVTMTNVATVASGSVP